MDIVRENAMSTPLPAETVPVSKADEAIRSLQAEVERLTAERRELAGILRQILADIGNHAKGLPAPGHSRRIATGHAILTALRVAGRL